MKITVAMVLLIVVIFRLETNTDVAGVPFLIIIYQCWQNTFNVIMYRMDIQSFHVHIAVEKRLQEETGRDMCSSTFGVVRHHVPQSLMKTRMK